MSAARNLLLAAAALTLLACGSAPAIGSFTATPAAIVSGDLTTLAWTVSNATSLSLSDGATVADVTGTLQSTVTPSATTTYTLTATNSKGAVTATATVTVTAKPIPGVINGFAASPVQAASGAAVTLSWGARGVVTQSIDQGVPALAATATSVVVHPTTTTTYTLTVLGTAGSKAATAQVTVFISGTPAITSFTATPATVAPGAASVLAWVSDGNRFSVGDGSATGTGSGTDLGPLLSLRVRPTVTTTYTLTAQSGIASATKTVTVTVSGAAATGLVYTNPTATTEAVKLVKNGASTPGLLVLDLVVNQAASASAFALNLPLDGDTAGSRDGSARAQLDTAAPTALPSGWVTVAPGFDVDPSKLNPGGSGTAPYTAVAKVATSGPLQGVLSAGIAQKPQAQCQASSATCVGAAGGDAALKVGDVLGHLRLVLKPGAGAGTVFDPATFSAAPSGYRALLRGAASTSTSFAVGKLVAQ